MLSKEASSTIFWVFGITRPGIELRSPRPSILLFYLSTCTILTVLFLFDIKSWRQHPTRPQLYGHLPPITKTIQVRRTRHAGHCWRSRDELLWTPTDGRAKTGRPARTYIQQLCEDTGCCPEHLPRAMNDREEWRERVRDIRATSAIWWWWWWIRKGEYEEAEKEERRKSCNLLSFLLRCGTRPYEWGTQWVSNSLVKVC